VLMPQQELREPGGECLTATVFLFFFLVFLVLKYHGDVDSSCLVISSPALASLYRFYGPFWNLGHVHFASVVS